MSSRILVVGSLNADLVVHTERFPQPGETLSGSELAVVPGGKGANQAVVAGRLGADIAMIGAVGADSNGDLLLNSVRTAGVQTDAIARREGVATGTAVITVDAAGENTIIVSPGANGTVTTDLIAENAAAFDAAGILCLCLEVPRDVVLASAERARAADATVLLNLSPYGPVPEALLAHTDILLLNEHEAQDLLGLDVEADLVAGGAATRAALGAHGIRRSVITAGAAGAIVIDGDADVVRVRSPKVDAVDTTGAGDAFMGALALRLAGGDDLATAAAFATTVGAFAATRSGAQASYPTPDELAEFTATHELGE